MENLNVVLTIFWPWVLGNLSIVSILFSNEKSNRCFKNFWPWISLLPIENLTVVLTVFGRAFEEFIP